MKRFFKTIGYILLALIVLVVALAFILPKKIDTQVTKTIAAPPQYVYNILKNPGLVDNYSAWLEQDPGMQITPTGGQGIGEGYSWTGSNGDTGRAVITNATADQLVTIDLYMGDREEPMTTSYTLSSKGESTDVQLDWHADLPFPVNVMGPVWKYMGKRQFGQTLDNLATLVKKRSGDSQYYGYTMEAVEVGEQYYITTRDKVSMAALQQYYSQALSSVFRLLQEGDVQATGADCALVYGYDSNNSTVDIAAALPVADDVSLPNSNTVILPAAQAISTDYYGNRAESSVAHTAIQEYLADRRLIADVPYVEEYITDVLQEKDPSKWLTRITYRLAGE